MCADWSIGSDKLYQLLNVMESVGVLRIVRIENDTKAKSVGEKLFFADPAFYSALNGDPGTSREALVAALCFGAGWKVEASRKEMEGDFVIRNDTDYPVGKAIPLCLLGFAY